MFSFSLITNTCEKLQLSREVLFGKVYVHYSIDDSKMNYILKIETKNSIREIIHKIFFSCTGNQISRRIRLHLQEK